MTILYCVLEPAWGNSHVWFILDKNYSQIRLEASAAHMAIAAGMQLVVLPVCSVVMVVGWIMLSFSLFPPQL